MVKRNIILFEKIYLRPFALKMFPRTDFFFFFHLPRRKVMIYFCQKGKKKKKKKKETWGATDLVLERTCLEEHPKII